VTGQKGDAVEVCFPLLNFGILRAVGWGGSQVVINCLGDLVKDSLIEVRKTGL